MFADIFMLVGCMFRLRTDKGNTHVLDKNWKFVEILAEDETLAAVIFSSDDGMIWILHEGCEGREKELWDSYVDGLKLNKTEAVQT